MQQLTLDPQSTTMLRISELAHRPPVTWLPARLFDSACVILFLQLVPPCDAQQVDFVREVRPILESHCYPCHGPQKQKSSLRFDVKAAAMRGGENYGPCIVPNEPASSPLIELVTSDDLEVRMPPQGPPLPMESIQILSGWIEQGALWPDGIDPTQLKDPKEHWSFQPIPTYEEDHSIDSWIALRLRDHGLAMATEISPLGWLRRVTLDLHGLSPSPEQLAVFQQHYERAVSEDPSTRDASILSVYASTVDELLDSPRYGERWAQHWLDVVRYADTHGFEVNTERPHAWHYRDYVIDAIARDTPFDQFVREQIAGDSMDRDTATGFLITASVLLPGQIGADEPSKRLARQDALDEIVVNIGQTFLGLSIGCARCHDHKFDPISQADYYAMQSFVAGVEYGDREVRTKESDAKRKQAESLEENIAHIDTQLMRLEPLARSLDAPITPSDPQKNEESFEPRSVRWVRMDIDDANRHPTLGLIEPCIDEFEIWTDDPEPRNIALQREGTRVTASGSRESAIHQLKHLHDGMYGNSHSWMSDQAGKGWVLFELPQPTRIGRIVWGRDREGQFQDRLATAYRISAGLEPDALEMVASKATLRTSVHPKRNTDRIPPTRAKQVRFTILETNRLEPCIDELEVITSEGVNVALESHGSIATSAGDKVDPGRHELRFVNDGQYGNSSSWMSSEVGKGAVTITLPRVETIERIVWGRDRHGQFTDRLATQYRIEIADEDGVWKIVALSTDRTPYNPDAKPDASLGPSAFGLTPEEVRLAESLQQERKRLESERNGILESLKAFAGIFRTPDAIHMLHRGDPEQPKDAVAPKVPSFFGAASLGEASLGEGELGSVAFAQDTPERERRIALANWIASPENPLTARVIANRIWQGHFGVGLVSTPNDFGMNGIAPSHPELLDWLARDLIRSGWSMKQLHRKIVLSRVYRQASLNNLDAARIDADARLLWRYPRRRLEAEVIRDSMLAISGKLDLKMYGRGYDLFDQRGGLSGFKPVESFSGEGLRRMIYAHKVRREREAVFGAFDCPDAGQSTGLRRASTTPIQALNLFNSRFTLEQSAAFAERVRTMVSQVSEDPVRTDGLTAQIRVAYQLALCREPTDMEIADALPVVSTYSLDLLCRALFNSNEFLFFP
jgi:hypothetical protein